MKKLIRSEISVTKIVLTLEGAKILIESSLATDPTYDLQALDIYSSGNMISSVNVKIEEGEIVLEILEGGDL